jgi:hypothetical protein
VKCLRALRSCAMYEGMRDTQMPDAHTLRSISVRAHRDPRVVRSVLRGEPTTANSRAAVTDAIRLLGLDIAVPSPEGPRAP